jgi:uncharacterized RmlC-like cupin family protein
MGKSRPVVVHPEEAIAGPTTPGLERRHHLDADGRWVGWSGWIRNDAGDVSGWHHHAANDTYVYVIRGSVTIEFGPGGADRIEARAGDLFHIPSQTIQRETTGADEDLETFVLRVGGEPEHVNVDSREGAGQ